MVDTGDYRLAENLLSPSFLSKLESLCTLGKKILRRRNRFKVKFWQGRDGFEFSEYRSYVPGDDLRTVDWNIYRRLGEIVVREYDAESPSHLIVAVDISPSMEPYHKFSYTRRLAASLLYIALHLLDKVSVFPFPQSSSASFQSLTCRGKHKIEEVFTFLQSFACQSGDSEKTFIRARHLFSRHSNSIAISDFYEPTYISTLPLLCSSGNSCTAVQMISRQERNPILNGLLTLRDCENGQVKTIKISKRRHKLYQKQFRDHLQQVEKFCRSRRICHTIVESERDISNALEILQLSGIFR